MPETKTRDLNESPNQKELEKIASTVDFGKLPQRKSLSIDKNGVVDIDSSHANYEYWLGNDE
ncbi:hypothetical protein [Oceanobacillus sp. CAU 1775]